MSEVEKKSVLREDKISIAEDVIAIIAGIAASEVEYVSAMSGGFTDGIAGMLGRKNFGKGIKVELSDSNVVLDLSIIVEYGCRIHEVARRIQTKVRMAVEEMTGLNAVEINVNIVGLNTGKVFRKDHEEEREGNERAELV